MVDDNRNDLSNRTADFAWASSEKRKAREDRRVRDAAVRGKIPLQSEESYDRSQAEYAESYTAAQEVEKPLADRTGDIEVDNYYGKDHNLVERADTASSRESTQDERWDTSDRSWKSDDGKWEYEIKFIPENRWDNGNDDDHSR